MGSPMRTIDKNSFAMDSFAFGEFKNHNWSLLQSEGCIYLECTGNNSNLWSIDATLKLYMSKKDEPATLTKFNVHFDKYTSTHLLAKICGETMCIRNYLFKNEITFRLEVVIDRISGYHDQQHDFTVADSINDTKIVVGVKIYYANKAILSNFSPFFTFLFKLEITKGTIPLTHVTDSEFEDFLQVLYGYEEVDDNNVNNLLKVAQRYRVGVITNKCEKFLLSNSTKSVVEKLIAGDEYFLAQLQANVFVTLTKKDLQQIAKDTSMLSGATVKELFAMYADKGDGDKGDKDVDNGSLSEKCSFPESDTRPVESRSPNQSISPYPYQSYEPRSPYPSSPNSLPYPRSESLPPYQQSSLELYQSSSPLPHDPHTPPPQLESPYQPGPPLESSYHLRPCSPYQPSSPYPSSPNSLPYPRFESSSPYQPSSPQPYQSSSRSEPSSPYPRSSSIPGLCLFD